VKFFKCVVCGYIHQGQEPPEKCPVCGAPREKFTELPAEEGKKALEEYQARTARKKPATSDRAPAGGGQPPGAADPPGSGIVALVTGLMVKHKAHPISVHLPNGLLPVAVLFLCLSFVFKAMHFERAALYNLVVVALAMPGVIASGWADWRARYRGAWTRVFKHKMAMALVVTSITWALAGWGLLGPESAAGPLGRFLFLALHFIALGAAGYAGHLGGKLVFKE